jgi:hypothetical protein
VRLPTCFTTITCSSGAIERMLTVLHHERAADASQTLLNRGSGLVGQHRLHAERAVFNATWSSTPALAASV